MLLPILILRRLIMALLFVVVVSTIAIFALANSSKFTKELFSWLATKYELKYDRIEGNLLRGITLENVRFRDKILAREITLRYNPAALLYKELRITKLYIVDGNVDAIQYFIASFQKDQPKEDDNAASSHGIGLKIVTNDVKITTLPFKTNGIYVQRAQLDAKHLFFDLEAYQIETKGLHAKLKSDLGAISLEGRLSNKILQIDEIDIKNLDIQRILQLSDGSTERGADSNASATLAPPFDSIQIERLDIAAKPTTYKKIKIDHLILHISDLKAISEPFLVKEGKVSLESQTNIAQANFEGNVTDNRLLGTLKAVPKNDIYTIYDLPLRPGSIRQIVAKLDIDKKDLKTEIETSAKGLLPRAKSSENIDVHRLHAKIRYQFDNEVLESNTTALVSTPYSNKVEVANYLTYHKDIVYRGMLKAEDLKGIDPKIASLLGKIRVDYNGTNKQLSAYADTRYLSADAYTKDMRHIDADLKNKISIPLSNMMQLPSEINASKIRHFEAKVQADIQKPLVLVPRLVLDSDLIAAELHGSFDTKYTIKGVIRIPKDSLLRTYQPKIRWDRIDPVTLTTVMDRNVTKLKMRSKVFKADVNLFSKKKLDAKVSLGTLKITAIGNPEKEILLHTQLRSAKSLRQSIEQIVIMDGEFPPIDGVLSIDGKITKLQNAHILVKSPMLIYKPKRGNKQEIKDLMAEAQINAQGATLLRYNVIYNKQKFYATKPSKIVWQKEDILLPGLWINDTLKISGNYNLKKMQGKFTAKSERFHIKERIVDIYTAIDIDTKINEELIESKGEVILLGGKVTPVIGSKSFATDDDIIILQDSKDKNQSDLMKKLSLILKVTAKKPIILKQPDLYAKLKPDLTIIKEPGKSKILYLGSVELLEGGYYLFNGKKFILKRSYIYFTGDVNKPLLDITATYQSSKYLITIRITGTPDAPNINFSSNPPLTREQILSVILFDTEEAADSHSGDEMMRMIGGVMAKAALSNLGINIDYLVIGEDGTLEIGKKINDKVTVIYINGEEPKIKIKYKHNRHMESIIGASQKSESYDIIYKGDF